MSSKTMSDVSESGARTESEDKLWQALRAHPGRTAAELSVLAEIGKSTAGKILAKWATEGSAVRTASVVEEGGRRGGDLWTPAAEVDEPEETAEEAAADECESADVVVAEPVLPEELDVLAEAGQEKNLLVEDGCAKDEAEVVAEEAALAKDDCDQRPVDVCDTGLTPVSSGRLAPGALRGQVEDYLRDHAGADFGPVAIAKALGGRSSGAVSNALDRLVAQGIVVRTADTPKRFALSTAGTAQSA